MRVLLAGQTFGPRNGPGVFTRNLARGLAQRGHDVTVVVPSPRLRSSMRIDDGIRIIEIRGVTLRPLYAEVAVTVAAGAAAKRVLDDLGPAVVHVQDHYPLSGAIVRAAHAASIPIIATNHFVPENITAQTWFGRIGPLRRAFEAFAWRGVRQVLNRAAVVTAPTATAAAILGRHAIPARAISCGVDTSRFVPAAARDEEAITAIYVGRLDRDKNVSTIIDAVCRVPEVRLVIAGRGREERLLRERARCAPGRIVFAGFVGDGELPRLLQSASFFVIAGKAELQSIATLEAMACGLPVVAANALALPELVTAGVNGELFDPDDASDAARAIRSLVERRSEWPAMSAASRTIAERHDIGATAAAYESLYGEVIARRAARAAPACPPSSFSGGRDQETLRRPS